MMLSSWRWPSGAGTGLILASIMHYSEAAMNIRHAVSPSYRYGDACPVPCLEAGPNPANWTLYSGIHEADDCQDTIHYVFNVHGDVDSDSAHHVFACTADGGQQSSTSTGSGRSRHEGSAATTHVTYDISHWSDGPSVTIDALQDATSRILDILSEGFPTDADGEEPSSLILFTKSPTVTTALYMGHHVSSQKTGAAALTGLQKILDDGTDSVSSGNAVAMQLCGSGYDGDGVVGFVAVPSDSSVSVRKAVQSWSQAQCASFPSAQDTSTMEAAVFHPDKGHGLASRMADMLPRAECKTTKVATGDSCASLAKKCGIKPADFTKYNPSKTLCSDLKAGQHVCCSSGTMPDFAPKPNPNGTCATYTIKANDDCPTIAAANSLTIKELKSFNEETWGFSGCDPLQLGARICLSKGDPPMPAPLSNAQCGPQKPGTKIPDGGTRNISSLNQCPLNVCCNIWGQCGSTKDYCIDTNTGAPGTAKKGTNGCISNCGLDIVQSDAPSKFIKLDYYEAFGMNRDCLFQDISQIDLDSTTHIHFSFATMDKSYAISVGETIYDEFQFEQFARLDGVHKVVTIGGWDFSTLPDTYNIFRDGVKKENRKAMATSILNFVKSHSIDGIDIDWEYPGAADIPGVPAGDEDEGENYLEFLKLLKDVLPDGITLSIAAPSSYWYLKAFPIDKIGQVVDYIVYMTYDLHGQYDYGRKWSQEGCTKGNCLRSHVNMTETMTSLAMVTKAGVPSNKVIVGVSSYARSFGMVDGGCHSPQCTFSGTATRSDATPGICTNTSGYISDAELYDILDGTDSKQGLRRRGAMVDRSRRHRRDVSDRVKEYYFDKESDSMIMVYDDDQWASFMDHDIRTTRTHKYAGLNLGGTTNWASDLEKFNPAPHDYKDWDAYKLAIKSGDTGFNGVDDPNANRTGNWTELTCDTPAIAQYSHMLASERWQSLGCPTAWSQFKQLWRKQEEAYPNSDSSRFTMSLIAFFGIHESASCDSIVEGNYCTDTIECLNLPKRNTTGPAAMQIWNSLVFLHNMYVEYYNTIGEVSTDVSHKEDDFMDTFAPIPPDNDDEVLELFLNFIGLGTTIGTAGIFNSVLKTVPFFKKAANPVKFDNYKDVSLALGGFGATTAKQFGLGKESDWSDVKQNVFKSLMGDTLSAWQGAVEHMLGILFDGSEESMELLTNVMDHGQLIPSGDPETGIPEAPLLAPTNDDRTSMKAGIEKDFYTYIIPSAWSASGKSVFVMDTGLGCKGGNLKEVRLSDDAPTACHDGTLYAIVYPYGEADDCGYGTGGSCIYNKFSIPPGAKQLGDEKWGGLTVKDLVVGSLRTYEQNGKTNGGAVTDPTNAGSLADLLEGDSTTPGGYVSLPVCSADFALDNWRHHGARPDGMKHWPCDTWPSPDTCEISSFENETSDGSPLIKDCLQIVDNIKGTQGSWDVMTTSLAQHKIASAGSCRFGAKARNQRGNVVFTVGAQDVVDIITEAVSMYGSNGKIGAQGNMACDGNVNSQDMNWGIY